MFVLSTAATATAAMHIRRNPSTQVTATNPSLVSPKENFVLTKVSRSIEFFSQCVKVSLASVSCWSWHGAKTTGKAIISFQKLPRAWLRCYKQMSALEQPFCSSESGGWLSKINFNFVYFYLCLSWFLLSSGKRSSIYTCSYKQMNEKVRQNQVVRWEMWIKRIKVFTPQQGFTSRICKDMKLYFFGSIRFKLKAQICEVELIELFVA